MASPRKSVLAMGRKDGASPERSTTWTETEVMATIKPQVERAQAQGVDVTSYIIDVDNPNTLDEITKLYKSKHWDGVSIGFGMRGNPALTADFENLVNLVASQQTPPPKFLFNLSPATTYETLKRAFPEQLE